MDNREKTELFPCRKVPTVALVDASDTNKGLSASDTFSGHEKTS